MQEESNNTYQVDKLLILLIGMIFSMSSLAAVNVISPQIATQGYISQRQAVDSLIGEAYEAFKSPVRISNAGFTGKLPSNMEVVAQKLLEAHQLAPYRVDLLFSVASAYIYNNDINKALDIYKRIIDDAPDDTDALTYLTVWTSFARQETESASYLQQLKGVNPLRAYEVGRFLSVVNSLSRIPITDKLSALQLSQLQQTAESNAIVTLGYALNPDGTMNEILIQRLEKTLQVARLLPDALIVVTGGVPQNNMTEGKLMADWLIAKGIKPGRIYQDNFARSTVENALYSRYALAKHRIKNAVIISSGSHIRRADVVFTIASWESGPRNINFIPVAAPDKSLAELQSISRADLQGIYRDGLKALGLWSFRSYPLQER